MSREVTHDANGPAMLDESDLEAQGGDVAVCQCGLSDDRPFCDGSHAETTDESESTRYKYEEDDDENPRHEIEEIVFDDE